MTDAPKMTREHIEAVKAGFSALQARLYADICDDPRDNYAPDMDQIARLAEVAAFLRSHTNEQA